MSSSYRSTPTRCRRASGGSARTSTGSAWGPSGFRPHSAHSVPETEEEYVEYFQQRIYSSQERQLYPLQEDLADWINKTLGVDYLTGDNFLDMLDNGVVVCHLARVIQERAKHCVASGSLKAAVPSIGGRCWENAARRSFFSRDNMENFIKFCRKLGVHENLLFESDDLVLQHQPRNVVLCLLEVARMAACYDVEPPTLVQLEKEIAEEESHCHSDSGLSHSSLMSWQFQPSPVLTPRSSPETAKLRHSSSSSALSVNSAGGYSWDHNGRRVRHSLILDDSVRHPGGDGNTAPGSDGVPSDTTEDDWSRGSGEDPDLDIDHDPLGGAERGQGDAGGGVVSELDRRVHQVARTAQRQCHCPGGKCAKLKVKKVGPGKYSIAGRNVFIRVLKGRHMMVRVGGGWDTLEHFLLRHDPCQVKVVPRDNTPTTRSYLQIRAKYRSPPQAASPDCSPTHVAR